LATESDDDLIRRLQKEADVGQPGKHDPYFDLPVAKQVNIEASEVSQRGEPSCQTPGRRELPVGGWTQTTEPIHCELRAGHTGAHRARFEQSRFRRRWHALEWSGPAPESQAPESEDGHA
jgi:hypothetical protein